ncbi:MAG: polynucleotide kinase-phosphatase [Candidatus Latescibacteria bacterium]|nr:polynucleotide kinase-phosphatase [Candidatus Latescibacterota bacterium]
MPLNIPEFSLVVLIGPSGAGKSTFARSHFKATEIVSSDACRGLVADDENNLDATGDAFELVHYIAAKRLAGRRLTVIDATSVKKADRQPLLQLAKTYHALPVAIVMDMPTDLCHQRNQQRPDRDLPAHVVPNQRRQLQRSRRGLKGEGFRFVYTLDSPEAAAQATIARQPLWPDRRDATGPFDIIGDVHGCIDELRLLLQRLDYQTDSSPVQPPPGRQALFVGDLVDRGPDSPAVLQLVMAMVEAGHALCVPGNHDVRLLAKLRGRKVKTAHGLAETLAQLKNHPDALRRRSADFLDGLVSHYVLDGGRLVVAHAGLRQDMQGRASAAVRAFCLYGDPTGELDEYGLPIRRDWAADYRGQAAVVYGHTPVAQSEWVNNTLCLDTGCVFGGALSALRYPERELVQVPAAKTYSEPIRPLAAPSATSAQPQLPQPRPSGQLDLDDVQGRRRIDTALMGRLTIAPENTAAALEIMARFAAPPQWQLYLPPTMAPCQTSQRPDLLEYPDEAFAYFRQQGLSQVICQEKHMGSRAVVVVCRNAAVAQRRFAAPADENGIVYTRTGRRFFTDRALEEAVLDQVCQSVDACGLWTQLDTDWLCLDAEIMPWSAKAQSLLLEQYAPVAAAAQSLETVAATLDQASQRGLPVEELQASTAVRRRQTDRFAQAYRRYCWPVESVADFKLAPFHLLASEGAVHADKDHNWHMQTLSTLCQTGALYPTAHRLVDLDDDGSCREAIDWWTQLTQAGGEGMVIKPLDFVVGRGRQLVQPALKCRGREYLRLIYGPEYTTPHYLERLRQRGLGRKRALALREFALGLEGLQRFVDNQPLHRVHECVFGVLALESEPVDPRL